MNHGKEVGQRVMKSGTGKYSNGEIEVRRRDMYNKWDSGINAIGKRWDKEI